MEYDPGYCMYLNSQESRSRKDKAATSAVVKNWLFSIFCDIFGFTLSGRLSCVVLEKWKKDSKKFINSALKIKVEYCFHAFLLTTKMLI